MTVADEGYLSYQNALQEVEKYEWLPANVLDAVPKTVFARIILEGREQSSDSRKLAHHCIRDILGTGNTLRTG